jgi:hypothetical protein
MKQFTTIALLISAGFAAGLWLVFRQPPKACQN